MDVFIESRIRYDNQTFIFFLGSTQIFFLEEESSIGKDQLQLIDV